MICLVARSEDAFDLLGSPPNVGTGVLDIEFFSRQPRDAKKCNAIERLESSAIDPGRFARVVH